MAITLQIRDSSLKDKEPELANYSVTGAKTLVEGADGVVDVSAKTLTTTAYSFITCAVGDPVILIGYNEVFEISAISVDNKTITLTTTPDGDDATDVKFQVGGYIKQIRFAWETLEDDLNDRGYLVTELNATRTFRNAQRFKALATIYTAFSNDGADGYDVKAEKYEGLYQQEISNTRLTSNLDDEDQNQLFLGVKIQK